MDTYLEAKVENMLENYSSLKRQYKWRSGDISLRFAAFLYALHDKTFVIEQYDAILQHINNNSTMFSHHRGTKFITAALLGTRFDRPRQAFLDLLAYENKMKQAGFKKSPYLAIASYALMLTCSEEDSPRRIRKALRIYKKMKEEHRWLTTADDYPVAVLLAGTKDEIDNIINEMEACYGNLHEYGLKKGNGLQFLSHLLTFSNERAMDKAKRCKDIYEFLKERGLKITSNYYGIIGYLALLGSRVDVALDEVIELSDYLKGQKSFRWAQKSINTLIASALVSDKFMEEIKGRQDLIEAGVSISIQGVLAAQTAAVVAASSAAAASSSSN